MDNFLQSKGIVHYSSCPHTPQQNGVVKKKHQHLLNVAKALQFHCNLPLTLWGNAISHVCYLIKKLPSWASNGTSPHELLKGVPPRFDRLKAFGCLCYAATLVRKDKFFSRAIQGIYIGNSPTQKGYIIYDLKAHSILVSRDMVFYETNFPLLKEASTPQHVSSSNLITTSSNDELLTSLESEDVDDIPPPITPHSPHQSLILSLT